MERLEKLINSRPLLVSLVCLFGFVSAIVKSPEIVRHLVGLTGAIFIPQWFGGGTSTVYYTSWTLVFIFVALYFSKLVSLIGYWKMKKWGVYAYLFSVVGYVVAVLFFKLSGFAIITLLIFLVTAVVGLVNLRLMD